MEEENSGFSLTKPESIPHFAPNESRQAPFVGARSEWCEWNAIYSLGSALY